METQGASPGLTISSLNNNAGAIVNYGDRISTGFVESKVNRVIAKRFVQG